MPMATLTLPPFASVNRLRGEHWAKARARKRREQAELQTLLLAARVPRPIPGDRVHVTAHAVFPTRRRRDEGNFRAPVEKALGDALQAGGWLSDDTPEHFTFGAVTFGLSDPEPSTGGRRPAALHVYLAWDDGPNALGWRCQVCGWQTRSLIDMHALVNRRVTATAVQLICPRCASPSTSFGPAI